MIQQCSRECGFDDLLEKMWSYLDMKRIYTKPRGAVPDYNAPVVVPAMKCTVAEFCMRIHQSLLDQFKHALVWGYFSQTCTAEVWSWTWICGWGCHESHAILSTQRNGWKVVLVCDFANVSADIQFDLIYISVNINANNVLQLHEKLWKWWECKNRVRMVRRS